MKKLLSTFIIGAVFGLGILTTLVFASWPDAPTGSITGGWLGEFFDLNNPDPDRLIVNTKISAQDPEDSQDLVTKNYLDTQGGGAGNSSNIADIASGYQHTLFLKENGTILAAGFNEYGELGNENSFTVNYPTTNPYAGLMPPTFVKNINNAIAVSAGRDCSFALKEDGTVWAWGRNYTGQLGDSTNIDKNVPVQVSVITDIKAISTGFAPDNSTNYSLALKEDGTVWAWGYNGNGQLGDGTTTDRSSPVQVSGLNNVIKIAAGSFNGIALKNDKTVWTWKSSGLSQISGLPNIVDIAAGYNYFLALGEDGTVWSWGYNKYGQLGNGTTLNAYAPNIYHISNLDNVKQIIASPYQASFALKNDGTVWGWGAGTTTTPVQTEMFNTEKIFPFRTRFFALKNNHTLWHWGKQDFFSYLDYTSSTFLPPSLFNDF